MHPQRNECREWCCLKEGLGVHKVACRFDSALGSALGPLVAVQIDAALKEFQLYIGIAPPEGIVTQVVVGAGPHVLVFSDLPRAELASYFAYDPTFAGGVPVIGAVLPSGDAFSTQVSIQSSAARLSDIQNGAYKE